MARKSSKKNKNQPAPQRLPMSYAQPYSIPPVQANSARGNNTTFVYEPIPIKKRNRQIIPVLMLIFFVLAIVAGVVVPMLGLADGIVTPELIEKAEETANVDIEETIKPLEEMGIGFDLVLKAVIGLFAGCAVYSVLMLIVGIIYLVAMCHVSQEINIIAEDYDRKHTPFFCLAVFLSIITCGIYWVIYINNLSARIGLELKRRSVKYKFDEGTYWGWSVFGSLLFGIGPIIFMFKFFKAMKKLIADYSIYG